MCVVSDKSGAFTGTLAFCVRFPPGLWRPPERGGLGRAAARPASVALVQEPRAWLCALTWPLLSGPRGEGSGLVRPAQGTWRHSLPTGRTGANKGGFARTRPELAPRPPEVERSRHPKAVGFTAITNCRCIHWALTECRSFSHIFPAMEPCYREGNQGSENPKVTQERPGIRTQVWTQDWPQRPNSYPRAAGHGSAWMPNLCSRERCGLRASGQDLSLGVGPAGSPAAGLTLPEMEPRSEH